MTGHWQLPLPIRPLKDRKMLRENRTGNTQGLLPNPDHSRSGHLRKKPAKTKRSLIQTVEYPLEYMLRVMRDPAASHARRDDMAKAAAPYLHPREKPQTSMSWKEIRQLTNEEVEYIQRALKNAARKQWLEDEPKEQR
jgi:hypothetical protein